MGLTVSPAAQSGTVHGIVKDTSGAIIPAATVLLTNTTTQRRTQTLTTGAGAYVFAFVEPGEYTLTVDHPGFSRLVREQNPRRRRHHFDH